MTSTASWAVDDPEQVALIAAHDGTAAELGAADGLDEATGDAIGDGVGVGVGVGVRVELALGDREGLGRAAEGA